MHPVSSHHSSHSSDELQNFLENLSNLDEDDASKRQKRFSIQNEYMSFLDSIVPSFIAPDLCPIKRGPSFSETGASVTVQSKSHHEKNTASTGYINAQTSASDTKSAPTENDLRQCLAEQGYSCRSLPSDIKIYFRLQEMGTTPSTLIAVINIVKHLDHPLMRELKATKDDQDYVLDSILQIFNNRGARKLAKDDIIRAHNDSTQIVRNLLTTKP